jgi:hypothetical protein
MTHYVPRRTLLSLSRSSLTLPRSSPLPSLSSILPLSRPFSGFAAHLTGLSDDQLEVRSPSASFQSLPHLVLTLPHFSSSLFEVTAIRPHFLPARAPSFSRFASRQEQHLAGRDVAEVGRDGSVGSDGEGGRRGVGKRGALALFRSFSRRRSCRRQY